MSTRAPSLSRRLVIGALLWIAAAIAIGGTALSYAFRRSVEADFDSRLQSLVIALVAATDVTAEKELTLDRELGEPSFERVFSGWYWQIEVGDEPVLRSRSLWDQSLAKSAPSGPEGETLRLAAKTVTLPALPLPVTYRVAAPAREIEIETSRFDRLLLVSLGALGAGLSLAVLVQVGYGLRPLRRLERDLGRVRSGEIERLPPTYPREVESLAAEMNRVLDHDEGLIERARAHVANLAHALKTPLAVLQAEIASPRQLDLEAIREQTAMIDRLVQHHLARAAAVGSPRGTHQRTPIAPVADAVANALRRVHRERAVELQVDVAPDLAFAGERQDLEEIVGNLGDNACKWARRRVRIAAVATRGGVRLEVDDDGPGLTPDDAERAIERGARLDEDTPGSGLGLAIVRDLASLYGGSLRLGSASGGGLRATVDLPDADSAPAV